MEWICKLVDPPQTQHTEQNVSLWHLMNNTGNNSSDPSDHPEPQEEEVIPWTFLEYSTHVLIPLLCVIGILGNLLNMTILGKRIKEGKIQ